MDLKEFEKRLNIEPRGQDPEVLAARRESLSHAAAYRAAQTFEDKLEAALRLPVAAADGLLPSLGRSWVPAWTALAAALALAVGIGAWLLPGGPSAADLEIRAAFVEHLDSPEPALISARLVAPEVVRAAFAVTGMEVERDLSNVTYLSPCVIGGIKGLHLVVTEDDGRKATLMMIPGEQLAAAADFTLPGMSARLLPTSRGPIALFGHQRQDLEPLSRELLQSISPLQQTARL